MLIIEDDRVLAQHYAEVLRRADMLVEVLEQPPANVIQIISQLRPDLILMDLYMPTCTGLEMTSVIRQIDAYQGIPIVFLSTEPVKEKQRSAMFLGGDDFLKKPISNDDLVYAVSHRADRFKALNALMIRDSLTGLLNHATLKSQLEILQALAQRNKSNLCFVMLDIDLFKTVNDRYGHPKGDDVICSLAHLLKNRLRASDVMGRYGGEEFAVILPDTELSSTVAMIDELRTHFEKITHYHESGDFNTTFSAGIVTAQQHFSMQDLLDQADQALYIAKHQGRNRVAML
ncbi:MAG: diguanylate cyclase [Methylococcales bacterium]|nr:diguanylate cyclase [Methylococcales bacterium]